MFDFEREFGIETENEAVLPPSEEREVNLFSFITFCFASKRYVTGIVPFFALFFVSFLSTLAIQPVAPTLIILVFIGYIAVNLYTL